MPKPADLNRCLAPLDQDHTIIAVIEMSQSSWLVAGGVPGIGRHPLQKLAPDQDALLLPLLPRPPPPPPRPPSPPPPPPPPARGGRWPAKPAARSRALPPPLRPAAMAS